MATEAHYCGVRCFTKISVSLAAALLVAWNGMLIAVPHNHVDVAVPQEALDCSASHPSSQTNHLHDSGRLLSPHRCVACLAGSTVAAVPAMAKVDARAPSAIHVVRVPADCRSQIHTHLPLTRGPPATV